jgi:hypothetical protein
VGIGLLVELEAGLGFMVKFGGRSVTTVIYTVLVTVEGGGEEPEGEGVG